MGKTFTCHFESCGVVFTKTFDLKKHIFEHEDPSKLFRCTHEQCVFITLYPRNLRIHQNSHANSRPNVCPDMVIDNSSSTERPCGYRANCTSALLKHRRKYHGYVTNPRRSRQDASATSQVFRRATPVSRNDSGPFPVPPKTTISSNRRASYPAKYGYARVCPSVTSPSSSMGQSFNDKHYSPPDTRRYGEVWNSDLCALVAKLIDANSSVASQNNNYTHHGVTTLPFPTLPNSSSTVLYQNSFHYLTSSAIVTSGDVVHTPPETLYDATPFTWQPPSRPEAESTDSDSVVSYAASSYNSESAGSYVAFPPSPAELPFDDTVHSETDTPYGDASNGNGYINTPAVEPIDANSSVTPQNNYADRGDTLPERLVDGYYSAFGATEIVPSSDLETEIYEDEIFFRGTGREGCLCPEMMINAGFEGWDTHQEYPFA